jgi:poly-gamma-glutamate capsule biosynthesis protein CapA/YwtB (metallophosphatase superfamily)
MLFAPDGAELAIPGAAPHTVSGRKTETSLLLVGDTAFGESYAGSRGQVVLEKHGYDHPLARLRPLLSSADYVIANLETPLAGPSWSPFHLVKEYVHWADPEASAAALRRAGVDAVGLANNHAYDQLSAGLASTFEALNAEGIVGFGAGSDLRAAAQPLRLDLRVGKRTVPVAVLSVTARRWNHFYAGVFATSTAGGAYPLARSTITEQIRALRQAEPELFLIVFPHWGRNYAWCSPDQVSLAHALIAAGASAVIGHGAHLFQEVEVWQERLIVYNLGNFVFLSPGRYTTKEMHPWSLAARLDFSEQNGEVALAARLYFLASDNRATGFRPYLLRRQTFDRAARLLLKGGTLAPDSREKLAAKTKEGRDEIGQHLRIQLGKVP